jgi:hypothetical protein
MSSAAELEHRRFRIAAFPAGVTRWPNPYLMLCHAASDLPYFREILAGEPDAGMVVSGWDTATWADALLHYLERRAAAARRRAALRLAARHHWDGCVEPLVEALGIEDGAGGRGGVQRAATAC